VSKRIYRRNEESKAKAKVVTEKAPNYSWLIREMGGYREMGG
jgi:hypothetical protein